MKVSELMEYVDAIMENAFSDFVKRRWLNQIEAEIQVDVLLMAPDGIVQYGEEDGSAEMIAPPPYDQVYQEYLFWQIRLAQQEIEMANNQAVVFNRIFNEYVRFVAQTINPGSGMAEQALYYLTAYQIAVKHGYAGSEAQWLESLQGQRGEPGAGLQLKGRKNTIEELPLDAQAGDGWLVGSEEDNRLYVFDGESWVDCGTLRGQKGEKGDTGETGPKGDAFTYSDFTAEQLEALKGEKGDTGNTGETGPQGQKGDKGDKGDTGGQGPKGDPGVYVGSGEMPDGYSVQIDPDGEMDRLVSDIKRNEDGSWKISYTDGSVETIGNLGGGTGTGAPGPAGADGKSAYQYAVEGGYTGTEAEFAAKMAEEIPTVDSTLTQSGQAADAAAVGNRLSSLSDEIVTTSESKVDAHNTGTDTHSDIRLLIKGLTDRLNALADSDDTTLDQLSEVVAYIKSNRSLIEAITTSKVSVADIIDNLTTNVTNKPLSAAQGVALKALIDGISVPDKLPNPNALTFSGAVTGSYDGSAPLSVEIPSGGGGSSGGSGKAKSQILIDQEITELTSSLSVTLEHDFHNLTAIISCGSAGAALTADSDGTAVASKIGFLIDTTSFGNNPRKVAQINTSTGMWKTMMCGAEWSDDLSVFKLGFTVEIATGANSPYNFLFGGPTAMYGTVETVDNVPRTGRTANIVVNGAYLNVGTKVVLWGEYYE